MDLREILTNDEKQMIGNWIDSYSDNGNRTASVDKILAPWNAANGKLYQLLGSQLIISKDYTYEKDSQEICDRMEELMNKDKYYQFMRKTLRFFYELYDYDKWAGNWWMVSWRQSLEPQEREQAEYIIRLCESISRLFSSYVLATNCFDRESVDITLPDGKVFRINKGCKPIKAIGKLVKEFNLDEETFEDFRVQVSQILNDKYYKGILHLSIHPMDYMTMSDNKYNWSSCMNWRNDGEYRRGTVEMMNSDCVVEAYITSYDGTNMSCPGGYSWNNKKWRELFVVTDELIAGIKGYPVWNRGIEKDVIAWLRELAKQNWNDGCDRYNDEVMTVSFEDGENYNVKLPQNDFTIKVAFRSNAMYCDFYLQHQMIFSKSLDYNCELNYSGLPVCMQCGSTCDNYDEATDLVCYDCCDFVYCADCGMRLYNGEAIYVDGEAFCEDCYNNLPSCVMCGDAHTSGELENIYFAVDDEHICTNNFSTQICYSCLNDLEDAGVVKRATTKYCSEIYYIVANVENSQRIKDLFGFTAEEIVHAWENPEDLRNCWALRDVHHCFAMDGQEVANF